MNLMVQPDLKTENCCKNSLLKKIEYYGSSLIKIKMLFVTAPESMNQKHKRRSIVTKERAVSIYRRKLAAPIFQNNDYFQLSPLIKKIESEILAREYNVSPKIVRDIWNHKCWVVATVHLWREGPQGSGE